MEGLYKELQIGGGVTVVTSREHTFGTDALLLADFAVPKRREPACDLGTGCGIIPLYWFSRSRIEPAYGVDIQPQAVEQFRAGIEHSGAAGSLFPVCGDLRALPPELPPGRFGLVSCNPPYQTGTGIRPKNPAGKIARHEVLCNIDDVCRAGARLLKFGGRLCVCQRPERLADTVCAMRENRLEPKRLRFVSKGHGEPPWLFLLEGKKGARPGLRALPPLAVYENGGWSEDMKRIYGPAFL